MRTRNYWLLIPIAMLTACIPGDPIFETTHTMTTTGTLTNACIMAAGESIPGGAIKQTDGDTYLVSNANTEIEVAWYRGERQKVKFGRTGIGFKDNKRDAELCPLIRAFEQSLITACKLDRSKLTIEKSYTRSNCND